MQRKTVKILSMAFMLMLILAVAGCGGGSSSSGGGTPVPTPTEITTALTGALDLTSLSSSAPSKAIAANDYKVQFGYYDESGNFVEVGDPLSIILQSGNIFNYSGSISTSVTKNLIVRLVNTDNTPVSLAGGYFENVIPSVSEGTVEVETVNNNTFKKANIVKKAKQSKIDINIAEVLSRIPPTTLYKLSASDVDAIANAFVAVIAKEQATVNAKGTEFATRYEALKAKAFELSQQALMWAQNGEYDEETCWEIYEAELKAWALKNRFTREEYYDVLGAKNNMFGEVVQVNASTGAITVDIPDSMEVILSQAGITGTVAPTDSTLGTTDDTIASKIEEKKTELAALTESKVNSEFDVIMHSIYELTEAVIRANDSISSADISVDSLVELTNKLVQLGQMNLDEYEIKTQIDLLELDFQKVVDILFGELLYHSINPPTALIPAEYADMDPKQYGMMAFFQLMDGGDDDPFETATDTFLTSYTGTLKNYLRYDEWNEYNEDTQQEELRSEFEMMDTLMNYASKSTEAGATKYTNIFGDNGFMKGVSTTYGTVFTTEIKTALGWSPEIAESMAEIFAYIFMFEIDKPLSLVSPDGEFVNKQNVMVKKLTTAMTFEDMPGQSFNYKVVNAKDGSLMGYARLWTKAEMVANFNEYNTLLADADDVMIWGDAGPSFNWQTFESGGRTWASFKAANGWDTTPPTLENITRIWAMFETDGGEFVVSPVPDDATMTARWLDKPLEVGGMLTPAAGADIINNISAFLDPFRMVIGNLWFDDEGDNNQYYNDFWAKVVYDEAKDKYFLAHPEAAVATPYAAPSGVNDRWVLDKFNAYIELAEPWSKAYANGKTFQFWGMLVKNSSNDMGGTNYTFIANEIREFSSNMGSGTWPMVATGSVVKSVDESKNPILKSIGGVNHYEYTIKDPVNSFMEFLRVFIVADGTMTEIVTWFDNMVADNNVITVGDPGPGFDDDGVIAEVMATWNDTITPMPHTIITSSGYSTSLVNGSPDFAKKEENFGSFRDFEHIKALRIPKTESGSIDTIASNPFALFWNTMSSIPGTQDAFKNAVANFGINFITWNLLDAQGSTVVDMDLFDNSTDNLYIVNYMPHDQRVVEAFENTDMNGFVEIVGTNGDSAVFCKVNKISDAVGTGATRIPAVYFVEIDGAMDGATFSVNGSTVQYMDWNSMAKYCYGLVNWMQPDGNNFYPTYQPKTNTANANIVLSPENKIIVKDGTVRYEMMFEFMDDKLKLSRFFKEDGIKGYETWVDMTLVDFRKFNDIPVAYAGTAPYQMTNLWENHFNVQDSNGQAVKARAFNEIAGTDINVKVEILNSDGAVLYKFTMKLNNAISPLTAFTFNAGTTAVSEPALLAENWSEPVIDFSAGNAAGKVILPQIFADAYADITFTKLNYREEKDGDGVYTETSNEIQDLTDDYFRLVEAGKGNLFLKWPDNGSVVDFDRWTISYDSAMEKAMLSMIEIYEPETLPSITPSTDVTAIADNEYTETIFIPGGVAIFDKYIANDFKNGYSTQAWLGQTGFGPNYMWAEMFKESATIYKTELHWEMHNDYFNDATQQWVNESEEEIYIIRWETLDNGDTFQIKQIDIIGRIMENNTGIWVEEGRLRWVK